MGAVVWVIPDETPEAGGNWVYAHRLKKAWEAAGGGGTVVRLSEPRPSAQLIHALNAMRSGLPLLRQGVDPGRVVITWTGTDLVDPRLDAEAGRILGQARLHTVLTAASQHLLGCRFPDWKDKVELLPPGLDSVRVAPTGAAEVVPRPFVLMVGGGRAEKGTLDAIAIVEAVRQGGVPAHLGILGPIREGGYWEKVEEALAARQSWVHWQGAVAGPDMPRWYRAADVVLNASWVEGLSNALLEALACGCRVVARDIPGNRAVIAPEQAGWLFADNREAAAMISRLLRDPLAGRSVAQRARQRVLALYHPDNEARAWRQRYRSLIGRACSSALL